ERIAKRRDIARELADTDIERIQAATSISLPKLRDELRSVFAGEIQRAIAARMGVTGLMHALKEREFGNVETLAHTSIAQFNNELTFSVAEETGTTTFLYSGPVGPITRPFCRAHAGKVFTLTEIERMDNGQGLPVRTSCGGYNCRHTWVPAPGRSAEQKTEVRTGKMLLLMDKNRSREFFSHERALWVEAQPGKSSTWYLTALPLARAHDGLNQRITNSPSDGLWKPIFRGPGKNNFDYHAEKRLEEGTIASRDEYRRRLSSLINDPNAEVFETRYARDGKLRYIVWDSKTKWMLLLDARGLIETAHPKEFTKAKLKKLTARGTLADFLGRF
ncbi:MAG TPA: hypothetical protein VNL69_03190, partial [Bacteroidota bacterium]|nr:hypothetical protein [Bacteroidota bacterium]